MPTTVHIPDELLTLVDERAKALRISRNRYVVRALRRAVEAERDWPAGFERELREVAPDVAPAVDEVLDAVRSRRRSKRPPSL